MALLRLGAATGAGALELAAQLGDELAHALAVGPVALIGGIDR